MTDSSVKPRVRLARVRLARVRLARVRLPRVRLPRGVLAAVVSSAGLALVLRLLLLLERRGSVGSVSSAAGGWLASALHLGASDPEYGSYVLDAAWYDGMARHLLGLDGSAPGFLLDQPFSMAPLYGYVLAAFYWLFGDADPVAVYVAQAMLGAATAGMTAWLAASLGAPRGSSLGASDTRGSSLAAWIAGLAMATYPVAIHTDITLLSVSLATFLTVVAVVALQRAWQPGAGRWSALLGGLALGTAVTARGNLLIVSPLVVLIFALRGLRQARGRAPDSGQAPSSSQGRTTDPLAGRLAGLATAGVLTLGLALPVGLSVAHNLVVGGELVWVSANGGINLYQGNNPYVIDEPVKTFRLGADQDATAVSSRLVASRRSGHWLTPAQTDRYWVRQDLTLWRDNPSRYIGLFLRKLHQTISAKELGDNTDLRELADRSTVLGALPWLYGPLAALGLLGLMLTARLPRRGQPGARDLPARLILLGGLASVALFFVLSRYRLALAPVLFAYAGVAVALLWARVRQGRWGSLGLSLGALLALLAVTWVSPLAPWLPSSWLADRGLQTPPPCLLDSHTLRAPRIESEYRLAKAELLAGQLDVASQRLGAILAADPGHTAAAVDLAALLLQSGQLEPAATLSERVLDQDGCDDKAWANLGTARLRQGRAGDAARAYAEAHRLDPMSPEYEAALGEALLSIGEEQQALALLQSAVTWGPSLWQPRAILGRRALRAGDSALAVSLLRPALALAPDRVDLHAMLGLALVGAGDVPGARDVLAEGQARGMGRAVPLMALRQAIDKVDPALPQLALPPLALPQRALPQPALPASAP